MTRFAFPLIASLALAGCATVPDAPQRPVTVGIIALNDFHGALEPPKTAIGAPDDKGGSVAVPAGGAAWLAAAVFAVQGQYENKVTVAAGDLIGASQLASSIYLDEPTIGVLNRIGLEFSAVGNHEFDNGTEELLRKQTGGCEKLTSREPCQVEQFTGATFKYLAASTLRADGTPIFPATGLKTFGSGAEAVTIGFIGLTLRETPSLVSPEGVKGLTFADEADTINAVIPSLKSQGADAIVVLIHQGGKTSSDIPNPNGCENFTGEILPILARLDPQVDVVVSGHSHWSYICSYGDTDPSRPFLLTSAGNNGQLVTDITLQIDPRKNRVVGKRARNLIVQSAAYVGSRGEVPETSLYPDFEPTPRIAEYVKRYTDAASVFAERPVGSLDRAATRPGGDLSHTGGTLGNLIADAQLEATRNAGAQIAFMNPFGIRAPLDPGTDGMLTFGDIYRTQPFNNTLVTQTMTGAEIKTVLEQGFDASGPEQVLAPSIGFSFRYDTSRAVGDRITALSFEGKPLDMAKTYRVTTNSFLASGGDTYTQFAAQRDAVIGISDLDALEAWVEGTRTVPQEQRAIDARPPA